MANVILLIVCFAAGFVLRRIRRLPDNTPAVLNAFIKNIGLPALALGYLPCGTVREVRLWRPILSDSGPVGAR